MSFYTTYGVYEGKSWDKLSFTPRMLNAFDSTVTLKLVPQKEPSMQVLTTAGTMENFTLACAQAGKGTDQEHPGAGVLMQRPT